MTNILHITLRSDIGGGPEHVFQLVKGLQNYCNFVACPNEKPYYQKFNEVIKVPSFTLPTRKFTAKDFWKLHCYTRKNKIEIVHSHGKGAGIYSRLLKLFNPNLNIIHTFHGWHTGEYSLIQKFLYTALEIALGFFTRKLICVSETEKQSIPSIFRYIFSRKFQIIQNGVSFPSKLLDFFDRKIDVVVVTRFDYQKNFDDVINLACRMPSTNFHILGELKKESNNYDYYLKKSPPNICFHGGVDDCRLFFRQSKILLSTSRWEGLPFAVIEAISEGCLPLLSYVTGHKDFKFDNKCYFKLHDIDDISSKLNQFLTNKKEWDKLASNAFELVFTDYSLEKMLKGNGDVYKNC